VTTTVRAESFFNFFETVEAAEGPAKIPTMDDDSDDEEN